MDEIRTLLVDAFADEPLAGNPAGVVPDAGALDGERMAAVARELSVSETAFLLPSDSADRRLRYFSPAGEVDLCGHATVGAFAGLLADGAIEPGTHRIETNVGELSVDVEPDGVVWMAQESPEVVRADLDSGRVADALGLPPAAVVDRELPLAVASTGLPWLLVPIAYLSELRSADPDPAAVESVAESVDAVGIYAFTFDTIAAEADLHARAFAPGIGIEEDPVTGTAGGAAGAYLEEVGAFDESPDEFVLEQGHFLDRPGRVRVRVDGGVSVGGRGAIALDGRLRVPEPEDHGIVEA